MVCNIAELQWGETAFFNKNYLINNIYNTMERQSRKRTPATKFAQEDDIGKSY